jgi:hypothetical protein
MKPRSLLAAAIILAALSGVVWWAKKHPQSDTSPTATKTTKLVDVPSDQVQQITIAKKDGAAISLNRESGKWQITAPEPLPADQDSIGSIATALSPLDADSVVDDKAADLAKFGLAAPSMKVNFKLKNGKSDSISFGDDAPAGSLVYVQHGSDPKVYAVNSSAKSSFDKSVNDLRDKRLLAFNTDKLTSIEVDAKKGAFTFAKNNQGDWQIVKPAPYRADSFQVEELVRKLQDARMDLSASVDQKKNTTLFSLSQPLATVKATDNSGTQTLTVRKNANDYYAKSSVVPGVFKVSSDLGGSLDKTTDDFRNHKLLDFGFNDPSRIEIRNGSSDSVYDKSGQDWKSNGKTLDAASVQAVVDQLRELSADSFPATGFANPTIEVSVTSNQGKRVERVAFTKTGDHYIGKRDGEPSLYAVTAKNIDDVVKAFAGIKPASAKHK